MASKYRIGTTIGVKMEVKNMPGGTLKMYARCEYGTFEMDNVIVDIDSSMNPVGISGKLAGANQKFTGKYDVLVVSSTKKRLCVDDAFELVSHSYDEDDLESEQTEVTLNFSVSFLTNLTSVSGYEEWRVDHDGTIEDYWAFIRDEPRLQKIETDIQANSDAIVAERERAVDAEKTLQENIEAEAGARKEADDGLSAAIAQESILREQADSKLTEDLADEIAAREQAIAQEASARNDADKLIDEKHSRGKIFCNGILEYKQVPDEDGYYLQKDIDGDIVCLAKCTSGVLEYIDTPIGKMFVVDDSLYVNDTFKIIPVGYTDTIIEVATPMTYVGDVDYVITGNNLGMPLKKIELTSIK